MKRIGVARAVWLLGLSFLALVGLLGYPIARVHGLGAGLMLGVLSATFWLLVLGTLRLAHARWRTRRLWNAHHGRPPETAQKQAMIGGFLRCVGPPLEAPLSGRPTAVWEYEIRGRNPGETEAHFWTGSGQAACFLETEWGSVPIRAGLLLHGFGWEVLRIRNVRERLDSLLANTSFAEIGGWRGGGRLLNIIDDALRDGDGFRWDARRPIRARARQRRVQERILEEGTFITCVGPFQPGEGLTPDQELFVARPEEVLASTRSVVLIYSGATLCFSLVQALYFWALFGLTGNA